MNQRHDKLLEFRLVHIVYHHAKNARKEDQEGCIDREGGKEQNLG
jgi:hypothetical protein